MSRFLLILSLLAQIGCANFDKNAAVQGTIYDKNLSKCRSVHCLGFDKVGDNAEKMFRMNIQKSDEISRKNGWDNLRPDPSDLWYHLELHR